MKKWISKLSKNILNQSRCGLFLFLISSTSQIFRCWLPFWSQLLGTFLVWRLFFAACFSEPLRGVPLRQILTSMGHPWSDILDFLKNVRCKCAPNDEDCRAAQIASTTPSKKQARVQKKHTFSNPNTFVFTSVV